MPNPQDIFQLAQQTATQVTASPENWRRFLYTAAHNYHTTYLNQLLIHAQRPDATACATMKYWNEQAHRKVMYGSKSIIILQRHQGVPTAKRVFSMTDTVLTGDKAAAPWEVTDAMPISSVMMKESCFHYHRTAYMVQRISSQVRF